MKNIFYHVNGVTMALFLTAALLTGCSTTSEHSLRHGFCTGESVVLVGEQPANLAFPPIQTGSLAVRNTYRTDLPKTMRYEEGRDYAIDYQQGSIRRTAKSRIPDFRTNMLFGVEDFDHGKFPGFGNEGFFAFIDYQTKAKIDWPKQASQVALLPKTESKLRKGDHLKIVAFGDSITAGGNATELKLIFWQRWADALQQKYPKATIETVNGATGGDTTRNGLERLQQKVLSAHPDLVLVGFGMNDHNVPAYGTPVDAFQKNLETIIDRIRKETGAEVVLYSTFPPNPKWRFGSHNMEAYARATEAAAREKKCAYADVYHNWITFADRKKPEDLLANNINHPNDFGHWMYFQVLQGLGL